MLDPILFANEEDLLMKKEKISAVPSFMARKSLQLVSSPPFDDPLSTNPLNKKFNSQITSAGIFLKKIFYFPC